ncbi:MAG TPA: hypothetical protein VF173_23055 [Thermoanaerobaculia bacterium]|nr:hypothetical protein [Thermoanaerobaculia bacterium]
MGFAIPTTVEELRASWRNGPADSFAQRFKGNVAKYQAQVIEPYERIGAHIRRLGVRIVPHLTLAGYSALFNDPKTHAVILFSHWSGYFIEFRDEPASIEALIQAVPEPHARIVDLCVCQPSEELIMRLRAARMQCQILFIDAKATPLLWLLFYRDLFRLLRSGTSRYLRTWSELKLAFFQELGGAKS